MTEAEFSLEFSLEFSDEKMIVCLNGVSSDFYYRRTIIQHQNGAGDGY